tara:strand:+ start:32 stop:328 length:297 start_codon:yes stop_codon:yes gene_type:complete
MKLTRIINNKKVTIISVFLFFYIILNLLDGERGLVSYYENQNIKKQLLNEKSSLIKQLALVEKKNELLTGKIDLDYLETIFRQKFMFGKSSEKIYKSQ